MRQIDVIIIGASGMGGGELLRYLMQHPLANPIQLVSRSRAGESVASVHPHLGAYAQMRFEASLGLPSGESSDPLVIFCAMGHGEFAQSWPALRDQLELLRKHRRVVVIDISADFRLSDPTAWLKYYCEAHPCPQYLDDFVYGLPEHARDAIAISDRIASPGCFATAINLCLLPLAGRISSKHVAIAAMTGSSGSGNRPSEGTHHPFRAHDLRAYQMLRHRHQAELEMMLAARGNKDVRISFVPHSAPLVRGIFATVMIDCDSAAEARELAGLVASSYEGEPFVHYTTASPRVAVVAGSNMAQVTVSSEDRSLLVMCAIDNLGKGMAGQAIQNMNIALGLDETSGLQSAAVYP
ncbi:N-acetyl-gamma-glutamyl-phosphate reductase [bacterium]|nr:N-acetyl-gamma-glutamyl-phosphate reductase [bacterium]UNM07317.1 MAG: N-acetyl-gamma-glutamyl-phosphate reductase [Planctomycetales bacterium]